MYNDEEEIFGFVVSVPDEDMESFVFDLGVILNRKEVNESKYQALFGRQEEWMT